MDARKITVVQQSFEKVAAIGLKAAEIFYSELFANAKFDLFGSSAV